MLVVMLISVIYIRVQTDRLLNEGHDVLSKSEKLNADTRKMLEKGCEK